MTVHSSSTVAGFYPVRGKGEASPQTSQLPPNLQPSPPPNVACCEPYIALNCVYGDMKLKIFWGRTPRPPPH